MSFRNDPVNLSPDTELTEVTLLGTIALHDYRRIDPASLPSGFYCYEVADIGGFDCLELLASRLPDHLTFAGTILTRTPVELDENGFRDVSLCDCAYAEGPLGNPIIFTIPQFMALYYPNDTAVFSSTLSEKSFSDTTRPGCPPDSLPKSCYSVSEDGKIVLIDRGKRGARPYPFSGVGRLDTPADNQMKVDNLNVALGITVQQNKAMVHGARYGWKTVSPALFDKSGNPTVRQGQGKSARSQMER